MSLGLHAPRKDSLNDLIRGKLLPLALQIIRSDTTLNTDLQERDQYGYEPIHWAAMTGSVEVFEALVRKGVNPFTRDGVNIAAKVIPAYNKDM